MKRILSVLLGLLIALPVLAVVQQGQQKPRFANTWAAIRDVEPGDHHTEKRDTYTILYQLSSGKPISVFIEFKNPTPDNVRKEYQKAIENSYKEWFKNAEKFIKESGHKKDFSQVLTRLKKPKVKFISSKQEADLVVVVEPLATVQEDCDGRELLLNMVGGCVVLANENKGHMFLPELEDVRSFTVKEKPRLANVKNVERRVLFTAILPHEIGHTLGLADQYEQAIHRTSHRLYRSTHVRDGMMKSYRFSCDDADGLVNLLDILYGTEPGRAQGWHSLCKNSADVYVNGVATGTGPYIITSEDFVTWKMEIYQNNKKVGEKHFTLRTHVSPYAPIDDQEILQRDGMNRVVQAKGKNGEQIFYYYNYGMIIRLITNGKEALRVETKEEMTKYTNNGLFPLMLQYRMRYAVSEQNKPVSISVLRNQNNREMQAVYTEGGPNKIPALKVELYFNISGKLEQQSVESHPDVAQAEGSSAPQAQGKKAPAAQGKKTSPKGKKNSLKKGGKKAKTKNHRATTPKQEEGTALEAYVEQNIAKQREEHKVAEFIRWAQAQVSAR